MTQRSPDVADIWFPLYAKDWLADSKVRACTAAQRGILTDLWSYQWKDGALPNDLSALCRMVGGEDPADVQHVVAYFFEASEDGKLLVSSRLVREKGKAEALRLKKRENVEKARKRLAEMSMSSPMDRTGDRASDGASDSPIHPTPPPPPPPPPVPVTKSRAPRERPIAPPWAVEVADALRGALNTTPDKVARSLAAYVKASPFVEQHGPEILVKAAGCYVREMQKRGPQGMRYAKLSEFFDRVGVYVDQVVPLGELEARRMIGDV